MSAPVTRTQLDAMKQRFREAAGFTMARSDIVYRDSPAPTDAPEDFDPLWQSQYPDEGIND